MVRRPSWAVELAGLMPRMHDVGAFAALISSVADLPQAGPVVGTTTGAMKLARLVGRPLDECIAFIAEIVVHTYLCIGF